jgi:non-ribosomal peptide synthetase component F
MSITSPHNLALKFQQVAESSAMEAAVFCEGRQYDFQTLNGLANRFAHWLAEQGVNQG